MSETKLQVPHRQNKDISNILQNTPESIRIKVDITSMFYKYFDEHNICSIKLVRTIIIVAKAQLPISTPMKNYQNPSDLVLKRRTPMLGEHIPGDLDTWPSRATSFAD